MGETPPIAQRVGHRIRRKREIMGKTQREIADAIGMGYAQYSKLEKGEYQSVRFEQLQQLAILLKVSADYLLLLSDDMGEIPPEWCPREEPSLDGVTPLSAIVP